MSSEAFSTIKKALKSYDLQSVAEATDGEVSLATLYHWMDGSVTHPHTRTLFAVAEAIGYEVIVKLRKRGR